MAEKPSNTANHQRLKEMMCHLTPQKAIVPYNVCFGKPIAFHNFLLFILHNFIDSEGHLWVASKGGLFKFDSTGTKLLFDLKNDFPRKMAPYAQVLPFNSKVILVEITIQIMIFVR